MFRSVGALIGDVLAVMLFVIIGLFQHGQELSAQNMFLVGWPFLVGVLIGHLAIRSWRAPFRLWPHGVFIWAITVVCCMAIRTLFSAGTETSFVVVTAIVTGVLMLGWRAVALFLTRGERLQVIDLSSAGIDGDPDVDTDTDRDAGGRESREADAGLGAPAADSPADRRS